jgi:hypothetical protein
MFHWLKQPFPIVRQIIEKNRVTDFHDGPARPEPPKQRTIGIRSILEPIKSISFGDSCPGKGDVVDQFSRPNQDVAGPKHNSGQDVSGSTPGRYQTPPGCKDPPVASMSGPMIESRNQALKEDGPRIHVV